MNIPSYPHGPCRSKLFIRAEYWSTVHSNVRIQQIFILIRITSIKIKVRRTIFRVAIGRFSIIRVLIRKTRSRKIPFRKTNSRESFGNTLSLTDWYSQYCINLVCIIKYLPISQSQITIIRKLIFSHIIIRTFLQQFNLVEFRRVRRSEFFRIRCLFGNTKTTSYIQIIKWTIFQIKVITNTKHFTSIVTIQCCIPQWITNNLWSICSTIFIILIF